MESHIKKKKNNNNNNKERPKNQWPKIRKLLEKNTKSSESRVFRCDNKA